MNICPPVYTSRKSTFSIKCGAFRLVSHPKYQGLREVNVRVRQVIRGSVRSSVNQGGSPARPGGQHRVRMSSEGQGGQWQVGKVISEAGRPLAGQSRSSES